MGLYSDHNHRKECLDCLAIRRPCGGPALSIWKVLVSVAVWQCGSVGVGMNERQLGAGQCNYQSAHFENYYHYDFIISNILTRPPVISPNCTMN